VSSAQRWLDTAEELIDAQPGLARADPPPWRPADQAAVRVASAWVCFAHGASRRRERVNEDKIAGSYSPWIVTQT
jgi:hypothetical protein